MVRNRAPKRPLPPKTAARYGPHFLREWRMDRDMTLEEVGEVVGLSHAQLGRIENRKQKYNQELLEKLATLYETTPAALIERDPRKAEEWAKIDGFRDFTLGQSER